MKFEAILFANAAMVDENLLLHVQGGAWRYFESESFPTTVAGAICGVVEVETADFGAIHTLSFQVDESRGSMTIDATAASEEMSTPRIAFAFPFSAVAQNPMVLNASVTSGADPVTLSVIVRRKQQQEP